MRRQGITIDVGVPQFIILVQADERVAAGMPPIEYGYVGFNAGEPINLLPVVESFPPDWHQRVAAEVNRLLIADGRPGARTVSGIFGAWPEVDDESDDDDADDPDDGTDVDEAEE